MIDGNGAWPRRLPPAQSAARAGLLYTRDDFPGIRRVRRGRGFSYRWPDGRTVREPEVIARIRTLAIPPAWSEVWICPDADGHLQATGRDTKGRKQYRYHMQWGEQRSETKYTHMLRFAETLPVIRERMEEDLRLKGLARPKMLATVVRLLEMTYIRIGNEGYARSNRSFGLTTLRDGHVDIRGTTLHFRFRGKSGQEHDVQLRDRRLARIVRQSRDVPGYQLFQYADDDGQHVGVDSDDVNAYLREITGQDFTAKDFRTWGGTLLAARELRQMGEATTERAARRNIVQAVRRVANKLGNRPATCRKYYIHPAIIDAYLDGTLLRAFEDAAAQPVPDAPHELDLEEATVIRLLRDRLGPQCGEPDDAAADGMHLKEPHR